MSFLKGKLGRSAAVVAFTLGAFQALSIVGALPAQALATCTVSSGVVTVATDEPDRTFVVYADQNGGIHVASDVANAMPGMGTGGDDLAGCTGVQTGLATTTAINITGASGTGTQNQTAWIELGTVDSTLLNTGTGDLTNWGAINWTVSLGANDSVGDSLEVVDTFDTSPTPVNVTAGANGIDLNSDGNLDVTSAGVEHFYYDSFSDEANDGTGNTFDLSGSTITGGPVVDGSYVGWSSVDGGLNLAFDAGAANTTSLLSTDDGLNTLKGGSGNDNIAGSGDGDLLAPGLGSDQISGNGTGGDGWFGDGQDTLDYSNTTALINVNLPGNTVSQGSDIDTIVGAAGNIDDVIGTAAGDTILGNTDDNWIEPGAGNDSVNGGTSGCSVDEDTYDVEDATAGVTVDLAAGTSTGGSGTDTLANIEDVNGSESADSFAGDACDNELFGEGGNDTLSGGAGNGADGDDFFDGGSGIDTLDYGANTHATTVDLDFAGCQGDLANECDELQPNTIENAILGTGDDTFFGSVFNNIVWPGGGQNAVSGGDGIDTVNYSVGYTAGITINLSGGGATGGGTDAIDGFENAVGTAFNDQIFGTDVVAGTNGANLLVGGKGNDSISANAGPDFVRAGAGNDIVRGGAGDDTLKGQGGKDNIRGSGGADDIFGGKGKDFCTGGGGNDFIKTCEKPKHNGHGPNGPGLHQRV